jgi:prevent-host-death family protein
LKTVSATEAKNRLGALIGDVVDGEDAILIENHGRLRAVIVSAEEWRLLVDARREMRRREAWDEFWRIAKELSARNADLTQEEADALADEIGDEAKRRVALRLYAE